MSIYPDELPEQELARVKGHIESAFDVLHVRHTPDMVDVIVDHLDDIVADEKGWGR